MKGKLPAVVVGLTLYLLLSCLPLLSLGCPLLSLGCPLLSQPLVSFLPLLNSDIADQGDRDDRQSKDDPEVSSRHVIPPLDTSIAR